MYQAVKGGLSLVAQNPLLVKSILGKLKISSGGNALATLKSHLSSYQGSAATIAAIIAEEAPAIMSSIIQSASDDEASQLMQIIGGIPQDDVDYNDIMGDGKLKHHGDDVSETLEAVHKVKQVKDRIRSIARILGIEDEDVVPLCALIQAVEPEDGAILALGKD